MKLDYSYLEKVKQEEKERMSDLFRQSSPINIHKCLGNIITFDSSNVFETKRYGQCIQITMNNKVHCLSVGELIRSLNYSNIKLEEDGDNVTLPEQIKFTDFFGDEFGYGTIEIIKDI